MPSVERPKDPNETLLLDLARKMEELTVNMAKEKEKRPKITNIRPNIWCSNCKGQGHLVTDCPSPPQTVNQCTFCGGKHLTANCWNLQKQQQFGNQTMIPPTQWDVNQVQSGNGTGWNGRHWKRNRNFNQGYVQDTPGYNPNQQGYQNYPNQPAGQPGTFTNPTWNKPARYIPVETPNIPGGGGPEIRTCYRCRQPGHLANKCPNERVREDDAPICGNCKQSGHIYQECNAPFNPNNRDQKVQEEKGRLHQVNRVETVKAILTRAQQKGKGPMIEETGPMQEEPEPILVDTNVEQAPNKEPIASSSHQPEVVPDNIV